MAPLSELNLFLLNSGVLVVAYLAGAAKFERKALFNSMAFGCGFLLLVLTGKLAGLDLGQQAVGLIAYSTLALQGYLAGWALVNTLEARIQKVLEHKSHL